MKPLSKTVSALPVSAALAVDLRAKAHAAAGMDIISFCVGEPDFDAPDAARRAGLSAIETGRMKYTNASGTPVLREAVSAALRRDCGVSYAPSELVVTTGAKYAVYAAVLAVTNPGDEVILPAPYWTSYYHILRLAGAVPVPVPCQRENGWKLTPAQLTNAVTERTKALLLNNPNNPTGAVYTRAELRALAEVCRRFDLYVLSDEIYGRLTYGSEPFCAAAALDADMQSRTVTIGGVSKTYAMTGWRIGYAAANGEIARAMAALLSHTTGSPNAGAQAAAAAALLGQQSGVERMRQTFLRRRDALLAALAGVPGPLYSVPQGAFYLLLELRALLASGVWADEADFALRLLDAEGVATVPCADYGAPGCIRLSYTLEEARMLEGVERMKRFIERSL